MDIEIMIPCAILICAAYIAGRGGFAIEKDKEKKSDYDRMEDAVNKAINEEDRKTRNLLAKALDTIGCQHEVNDKGNIVFKYQGEEFSISASDDGDVIWVYNVAWRVMNIDDPKVGYMKQAVNKANAHCGITSLYTIDDKQGLVGVHSRGATYFAYNMPDCAGYLKDFLDGFFYSHKVVEEEFVKICNREGK